MKDWLLRFLLGPWKAEDYELPPGVSYQYPYFYTDPEHFIAEAPKLAGD